MKEIINKKNILIGIIILTIIFLITFLSFNPNAFFGFNINSNNKIDSNLENNLEKDSETKTINSNLSYQVLENTKLIIQSNLKDIKSCPNEGNLIINIKNEGASDAKRVKVLMPDNVRILRCNNCEIDILKKGEEKEINAIVCKQNFFSNQIKIISANSKEILFEIN